MNCFLCGSNTVNEKSICQDCEKEQGVDDLRMKPSQRSTCPDIDVMVSTAFIIEGYDVEEHLGAIGSEYARPLGMLGEISTLPLEQAIELARTECFQRLSEKALALGGNAVIGTSFNVKYFEGYQAPLLVATALGTAVKVARKELR